MTSEEKLRNALADDKSARAAADQRLQDEKAELRRQQEIKEAALVKFAELKPLMQAAIDRLQPMLRENEISVNRPSLTVTGALDRMSYSAFRGNRAIAAINVILHVDCSVQIEGSDESFSYDDARLTTDLFFNRFADIIATRLRASFSSS